MGLFARVDRGIVVRIVKFLERGFVEVEGRDGRHQIVIGNRLLITGGLNWAAAS